MSEPIRVTREQWDAACNRYCKETDAQDTFSRSSARVEFARILGPRPAPDTPPDIEVDGLVIATATTAGVYVDTADLALLLPWVRDHLLPWLEAQVEEANDA